MQICTALSLHLLLFRIGHLKLAWFNPLRHSLELKKLKLLKMGIWKQEKSSSTTQWDWAPIICGYWCINTFTEIAPFFIYSFFSIVTPWRPAYRSHILTILFKDCKYVPASSIPRWKDLRGEITVLKNLCQDWIFP